MIGVARIQNCGNTVPDHIQKVRDDRRTFAFGLGVRRIPNHRGDQNAIAVKYKGFNPCTDRDRVKSRFGHLGVKRRRSAGEPRFKDIGDQAGFLLEPVFALQHQAVAERVHEKDTCNQDDQGHQVEDDDLAGQGRMVQRNERPLAPPVTNGQVHHAFGRDPIFADQHFTGLLVALLRHDRFGNGRHSSL
jgi:hypothetical protein